MTTSQLRNTPNMHISYQTPMFPSMPFASHITFIHTNPLTQHKMRDFLASQLAPRYSSPPHPPISSASVSRQPSLQRPPDAMQPTRPLSARQLSCPPSAASCMQSVRRVGYARLAVLLACSRYARVVSAVLLRVLKQG